MSLDNTRAKYSIEITSEGHGAEESAERLKKVEVAANNARHALQDVGAGNTAAEGSFKGLHRSAAATHLVLANIGTVSAMLGSTTIPQITTSALVASGAMSSLRSAAIASGASLGVVGGALAALAATLATAATAWEAYKAKQTEASAREDLVNQRLSLRERLLKTIKQLEAEKRIPEGSYFKDYDYLGEAMWDSDLLGKRMAELRSKYRAMIPTAEQEKAIQDLDKVQEQMVLNTLDGYQKERHEAWTNFKEREKQLKELARLAGFDENHTKVTLEGAVGELRSVDERINARERADLLAKEEAKRQDLVRQTSEQIAGFERQITLKTLTEGGERTAIAEREYRERRAFYEQLYAEGKIDEEKITQLYEEASIKRLQLGEKTVKQSRLHIQTVQDIENAAAESFASGFAQAFVSFASGTESAGEAFKRFAASFMQQVAAMIMQMLILRAISSAFGMTTTTTVAAAPAAAAGGGVFPRYMAGGGLAAPVSSATYLPRFNVVAGEAGMEMLTVLARPRFMELGGVQAMVGRAGAETLAVTRAADLDRSQANGRIVIEIAHSDESKARIIESSVQAAEIRVTRRLNEHSPIRSAVKKAVA